MVLDKKETTVAYRCPACGSSVMSMVGIFALTADLIKLKCPCGESELELIYTRDKKVRLNVPCLFCPNPHSYIISSQMFFDKDLFALPCSYSGVDMCFVGAKDKVQDAMKKSEQELLELLGDTDFNSLADVRGENLELTDPQVLDIVMYVVRELADEGAIECGCENNEGEYDVEIHDSYVKLVCKKCGKYLNIPVNSLTTANDFLNCDKLVLK